MLHFFYFGSGPQRFECCIKAVHKETLFLAGDSDILFFGDFVEYKSISGLDMFGDLRLAKQMLWTSIYGGTNCSHSQPHAATRSWNCAWSRSWSQAQFQLRTSSRSQESSRLRVPRLDLRLTM